MKTIELPSQLRIAAIATSALMLLSASARAVTLNGSGLNLKGVGVISNAPHITHGSQFNVGWDQPLMQGYMVPAAQLTGLSVDNTAVDPLDLLPVQLQSAAIIDNSGFAVVAMTAGATPGAPGVISFRNPVTGTLDASLSADSLGNLTVSGSPLLTTANSPGLLSGEFVIRPSSNQGSLGSLLLEGTYNGYATNIPKEGPGTRMMWYPEKGAFRAGSVKVTKWCDGTVWNNKNVGTHSVAFGENTEAKGMGSVALGRESTATGHYSFSNGILTKAIGYTSFAVGWGAKANHHYSNAIGAEATANGQYSTAIGSRATTSSHSQVAVGTYNRVRTGVNVDATDWKGDSYNTVFDVGIGDSSLRKNGLAVMQDGSVEIGLTTDAAPTPPLHIKADGSVTLSRPQGDISMGVYQ